MSDSERKLMRATRQILEMVCDGDAVMWSSTSRIGRHNLTVADLQRWSWSDKLPTCHAARSVRGGEFGRGIEMSGAISVFLVWAKERGSTEDWSLVGIGSDESNAKIMVEFLSQSGRVGKIQNVQCNVFQPQKNLDISTPYTVDEHWGEESDGH